MVSSVKTGVGNGMVPSVNIGESNGLEPSGDKPFLSEPMSIILSMDYYLMQWGITQVDDHPQK